MSDRIPLWPGGGPSLATDEIGCAHFQRIKVSFGLGGTATDVSSSNPLPVSITGSASGGLTDAELRASAVPVSGTFWQATQPVSIASTVQIAGTVTANVGTVPVTGTFWQATQPVSIASSVAVTGPLTDTQLRASAVPVSIASMPSTPVTGTFWQATQPISGTVTANAGAGTFAVSGPLTDTQLRASAVPVSGAFFQATQPVSIAATVATRDLKDNGRTLKVFSAAFTAATTEALVTLTPITNGTAGTTGTSFTITSGKTLRLQSLALTVKNAGAAAQGCVVNLRMSASGAVTASSPLIASVGAGTYLATANVVGAGMDTFPDGIELSGTMQFGISQVGTATAGNAVTLIGYEY